MLHPHFNGKPILVGDIVEIVDLDNADRDVHYTYREQITGVRIEYDPISRITRERALGRSLAIMKTPSFDEIYVTEADCREFYYNDPSDAAWVVEHFEQEP